MSNIVSMPHRIKCLVACIRWLSPYSRGLVLQQFLKEGTGLSLEDLRRVAMWQGRVIHPEVATSTAAEMVAKKLARIRAARRKEQRKEQQKQQRKHPEIEGVMTMFFVISSSAKTKYRWIFI